MNITLRHRDNYRSMCILAIALFLPSLAALADGPTIQRPLSDFLSTQGKYCTDDGNGGCYLFVPPDPNFLGWTTMLPPPKLPVVPSRPEKPLFAGVDYAGLANAYAPGKKPVFSGSITERPLSDGRAEVTVLLRTKNANAWVIELEICDTCDLLDQIANKATLFGHRPRDVVNPSLQAKQALADTHLHVRFINTAPGAPLPDLVQLNNNPDILPGVELRVSRLQRERQWSTDLRIWRSRKHAGKMHDRADGTNPQGWTEQSAYGCVPGGKYQPLRSWQMNIVALIA